MRVSLRFMHLKYYIYVHTHTNRKKRVAGERPLRLGPDDAARHDGRLPELGKPQTEHRALPPTAHRNTLRNTRRWPAAAV